MDRPKRTSGMPAFLPIVVVGCLIYVYVVLRYTVFKGVAWEYLPLYVTNKALGLFAVTAIGVSYALGPIARVSGSLITPLLFLRKPFGLAGFFAASLHALFSLILFSPYFYPSLFVAGKLSFFGELTFAFSAVAYVLFALQTVYSLPGVASAVDATTWKYVQKAGFIAYLFVMVHVYTIGVRSWIDHTTWPQGLYPVSLVAFLIIFLVFVIRFIGGLSWFRRVDDPGKFSVRSIVYLAAVSVILAAGWYGLQQFLHNAHLLLPLKNLSNGVSVSTPINTLPVYPHAQQVQMYETRLRFAKIYMGEWTSPDAVDTIGIWYRNALTNLGWTDTVPQALGVGTSNVNMVFRKSWNSRLQVSLYPTVDGTGTMIHIELSPTYQPDDVIYPGQ